MPTARHAAALLLAICPGCIASNVLDAADRAVVTEQTDLQWTPATAADVPGLYESEELRGDAAASLLRLYYYFASDGRYTAAALVNGEEGPRFQAQDGTWTLDAAGMGLDGAPAVTVDRAVGHLRIAAPSGTLRLRRLELR